MKAVMRRSAKHQYAKFAIGDLVSTPRGKGTVRFIYSAAHNTKILYSVLISGRNTGIIFNEKELVVCDVDLLKPSLAD